MGFCYEGRKLVCDKCNKAGARKVRCPFNACPSIALCPECRKLHKALTSKAGHRAYGCERAADKYRAADEHAARLRAEGKFLRVAAMGVDLPLKDGRTVHAVHVIFRGAAGAEKGYYMSPETYDAFPLLASVTVEDYADKAKGFLLEAPTDFYSKPTLTGVSP